MVPLCPSPQALQFFTQIKLQAILGHLGRKMLQEKEVKSLGFCSVYVEIEIGNSQPDLWRNT